MVVFSFAYITPFCTPVVAGAIMNMWESPGVWLDITDAMRYHQNVRSLIHKSVSPTGNSSPFGTVH